MKQLDTIFLKHSSDLLGETSLGLSGSEIVKLTTAIAFDFGVNVPHSSHPIMAGNKRTALFENLRALPARAQFIVIKEMCDDLISRANHDQKIETIKSKLIMKYPQFATDLGGSDINAPLIEETRHWLDKYPAAQKLYDDATRKYEHGVFARNVLDDLRLSLESMMCQMFDNSKSLENQIQNIGTFVKQKGGSKELSNMLVKLIDYYTKYQNLFVKHNDAVKEEEVDIVFELTASIMKHLAKLNS